jgi:RND family efflux transporter MFP subunit
MGRTFCKVGITNFLRQMAVVGATGVLLSGCGKAAKTAAPAAPSVTVTQPEERSVTEYEDLPGRIDSIEEVEIKARVKGFLNQVNFNEGAEVKKGDLLYTIDPREYQAEVDSRTAALQQAQAQLAQARSDYQRSQQLSTQKVIAAQETERQATAVLGAEGAVRSAQAALDRANLDKEYTEVRAPITGKISRTRVTQGNLVEDGDTLTSIVSQDPVYVYFDAPERVVLQWDKATKGGGGDGFSSKAKAFVGLLNEEGFPREAKVDFTDNELNTGTGTLRMRALVPNDDRRLRSGLYARVRLTLDDPRNHLLVPERAIGVDQGQRFVYVVDEKNAVQYRKVSVGQVYEGKQVILEGIKPADRVIVEGTLSVRPGQTVQPAEFVAMTSKAQPATEAAN